ncbi:MAG: hypothetical protein ACRCSI_06440 [Eubacterium aggregans]
MCIALFFIIMGHAQSERGVPVSYIKEESDAYTLAVEVRGDVELRYKGNSTADVIRGLQKEYLLKVDEKMDFEVLPNSGCSVQSMLLDDKNITSNFQNAAITIEGKEKPQHLLVVFSTRQPTVETGIVGLLERNELKVALIFLVISVAVLLGKRKIFRN